VAHCYKFAIVRLAPDDTRDERMNVGAVVMSEGGLDMRISRRLERARALSAAIDIEMLRRSIENLRDVDERLRETGTDQAGRFALLSRIGPLALSPPGTFTAEDAAAYETRIDSILKVMVDPEPALARPHHKRSKLFAQMKKSFRDARVLATKDETIDSHRVVRSLVLDEGLVADFALKNGTMHVIETVDASDDESSPRRTVSEIAVSGLVLERARMTFGEQTVTRMVYSASAALEKLAAPALAAVAHQGAQIINWASHDDRLRLVHTESLATPLPRKRGRKAAQFGGPTTGRLLP
jgi:hypothetical protein